MTETTAAATGVRLSSSAEPLAFDLPCARCGYNLRGLSASGACPECAAAVALALFQRNAGAVPPAAARVLASGLTLLELAAFVAFITSPIALKLRSPSPTWTTQQVAELVAVLFPLLAGWRGVCVLMRRSAVPRRFPGRWHAVRWGAVVCSSLGLSPLILTVVLAVLVKDAPELVQAAFIISTGAVAAATSCTYLYVSRVAAAAGLRAISWVSREFGAIVLGVTIWAYWTGRVPRPTTCGADRVVGSAFPITMQGATEAVVQGRWLDDAPVIAMGVTSIAAVLVLDQLRRSFSRLARSTTLTTALNPAGVAGRTAASSRP